MSRQKYQITVGEPWNYDGPDGQNLIIGEIIKVISPTTLVFRSDKILTFDNNQGQILILKARYEKETLIKNNSYGGIVGGGLLLSGNYEDENSIKNIKYVIIGGLKKY